MIDIDTLVQFLTNIHKEDKFLDKISLKLAIVSFNNSNTSFKLGFIS